MVRFVGLPPWFVKTTAAAGLLLILASTGCGTKDFNDVMAEVRVEEQPVHLDGDQVTLTERQIECGAENDLWEMPTSSGDRTVARLLKKGRDLKFYDDVVVREAGSSAAYIQVRGDFMVDLTPPPDIKEGGEPGVKVVIARVGAIVMHACFPVPLPIMGVRRGQFSPDALPQLRYIQVGNDWQFERLLH